MRVNPLNDLIYNEGEPAVNKYFNSQEGSPDDELDNLKNEDQDSDDRLDMNDNIFLFLD